METKQKPDQTAELFIRMALSSWETQNTRLNKLVDSLSNEELMAETAPGRNSGLYLLGHLAAVSDGMIPILGWGKRLHPELDPIFLSNPDKSGIAQPGADEVRKLSIEIQKAVNAHIAEMKTADWFQRHTVVSEEDFAREPHRNKLNILINRANHHSYHLGQMAYLARKK